MCIRDREDVAAFSAYSDINASLTENYFAGDKRAALVGADDAILQIDVYKRQLLHLIENLHGHDGRNRIGNQDVPVFQLADVAAVAQHVLNDIESHWPTALILDALFIEPIPNLPHRLSIIVPLEGFCYKRCGERVNFKAAVCIDSVAERDSTARELAFQDVYKRQLQ